MKKIISALLCILMLTVTASAQELRVYVNNRQVAFDQPPLMYRDMSYVPFRAIFQTLGMAVQWHEDEGRATAYGNGRSVSFIMGYDYIFVNDIGYPIPSGPIIENSRLLVPLRALIDGIDGEIYWDEDSYSVIINSERVVDDSNWKYDVLYLTNRIRAERGLSLLAWDDSLAETGREHCMDMAARGYFAHTAPDGTTPFDRMVRRGIYFTYAGENIAAGQIDPEAVVDAWVNSPEHFENIVNPFFTRMGAAFTRGGDIGIYWAQEFAG